MQKDIDGVSLVVGESVWFAYERGLPIQYVGEDGDGYALLKSKSGHVAHVLPENLTHNQDNVPYEGSCSGSIF